MQWFFRAKPALQPRRIRHAGAMKRISTLLLIVLLGVSSMGAAESRPADAKAMPPQAQKLAQTISLLTGVAISPLMGVSGVGAYQYFQAKTPEARARLPWYANPLFWVPALLLVGVCFVKDTAGTALPSALKKPFDVADTCEHKISGLVATGAFVPIAASIFTAPAAGASLGGAGFAAVDLHVLYNALMVPISMAAFFVVFLASNAINILILLSPFTTVDAALKSFRLAILGTVVASAWANPWVGAAWALIIIFLSYLIAGWSFRLSHFGLVFVWEFLTLRRKRFTPDAKANSLFLSRKINKVPARTYGKLSRDDQRRLVLNYRPWLVLPQRTLVLPEGNYCVGQGLFFSEIHQIQGDTSKAVILLPPRYQSHEQQLVGIYGLVDVRPVGLRAAWAWIRGMFGGAKTATA
jgi:hypothetical protein